MAKRTYKKRTKSTKAKTYQDYLDMRHKLEDKGYVLKDLMSKSSFEAAYERIRLAKKAGEIKSQPWQVLKSRETLLRTGQAEALSIASKDMFEKGLLKELYQPYQLKKLEPGNEVMAAIGKYLNENKEILFSGNYE